MAVTGTGLSASLASVAGAIRQAAQVTGANFDYLLATAKVESNLNPNSRAATSSATGLFQFIEQTWLATLKRAGPSLGYGNYAKAIVQTPDGGYAVANPAMRDAVLGLRRDAATNAAMAGAFTQANGAELRERLGRPATDGELYIAHFLGATGAARLVAQAATAPGAKAADLFPGAADANRAVFYDRQGRPRSAGQVYSILVGRFEAARQHTLNLAAGASPKAVAPAAEPAPDPAGTFDAFAMVSAVPIAKGAERGPAFHSLFQTGGPRQPISPMVGALWGGSGGEVPGSLRAAATAPEGGQGERGGPRPLGRSGPGHIRGTFDGAS